MPETNETPAAKQHGYWQSLYDDAIAERDRLRLDIAILSAESEAWKRLTEIATNWAAALREKLAAAEKLAEVRRPKRHLDVDRYYEGELTEEEARQIASTMPPAAPPSATGGA